MYERFEMLLSLHGVRTAQVARATGIDKATFSYWKKGKYTPKADKLQKIADYFGVTIAYLMGWDEEQVDQIAEERKTVTDSISAIDKVRDALQDTGYFDAEFTDDEIIDILKYAKVVLLKRDLEV